MIIISKDTDSLLLKKSPYSFMFGRLLNTYNIIHYTKHMGIVKVVTDMRGLLHEKH